jgi:hypothetical protein
LVSSFSSQIIWRGNSKKTKITQDVQKILGLTWYPGMIGLGLKKIIFQKPKKFKLKFYNKKAKTK